MLIGWLVGSGCICLKVVGIRTISNLHTYIMSFHSLLMLLVTSRSYNGTAFCFCGGEGGWVLVLGERERGGGLGKKAKHHIAIGHGYVLGFKCTLWGKWL